MIEVGREGDLEATGLAGRKFFKTPNQVETRKSAFSNS